MFFSSKLQNKTWFIVTVFLPFGQKRRKGMKTEEEKKQGESKLRPYITKFKAHMTEASKHKRRFE